MGADIGTVRIFFQNALHDPPRINVVPDILRGRDLKGDQQGAKDMTERKGGHAGANFLELVKIQKRMFSDLKKNNYFCTPFKRLSTNVLWLQRQISGTDW
jgi:hypothetical protein